MHCRQKLQINVIVFFSFLFDRELACLFVKETPIRKAGTISVAWKKKKQTKLIRKTITPSSAPERRTHSPGLKEHNSMVKLHGSPAPLSKKTRLPGKSLGNSALWPWFCTRLKPGDPEWGFTWPGKVTAMLAGKILQAKSPPPRLPSHFFPPSRTRISEEKKVYNPISGSLEKSWSLHPFPSAGKAGGCCVAGEQQLVPGGRTAWCLRRAGD